MSRVALNEAYPQIRFLPRSRNWWAWLKGVPAECEHLDSGAAWMATFIPDTLYLRGKSRAQREAVRPEVSLCRECLLGLLREELAQFSGRVVAFEPDAESFSQYFFVAREDFEAAGLLPEISAAIAKRLGQAPQDCEKCSARAGWLWFPREEVGSLDEAGRIQLSRGKNLCAAHGAKEFCRALEKIPEANVYYMNAPYGESGAYLWI
ncbi:MAG: hypothetical protein ACRD50_07125 [Candidatus Acidiferrales bacterium]